MRWLDRLWYSGITLWEGGFAHTERYNRFTVSIAPLRWCAIAKVNYHRGMRHNLSLCLLGIELQVEVTAK
jgi:hypothetical protein